jgi:hypothetical protein
LPGAVVTGSGQLGDARLGGGTPSPLPTTTSAADRRFLLANVPPGLYSLSARAKGFAAGEIAGIEVHAGVGIGWIELALEEGGFFLSGRVLDAGGGPVPGSTLRLASLKRPDEPPRFLSFTETTDANGNYGVKLPSAYFRVLVSASGYTPALGLVDLKRDERRDFRLEPGAAVNGRVVEAGSRRPIEGAQVLVDSFADREQPKIDVATSDDHGTFRVANLPSGAYRLMARKGDLVGASAQRFTVTAGDLIDGLTIEVAAGLTVAGTVRLGDQPVEGARVMLNYDRTGGNSGPLMTGSDRRGAFLLRGLLPGEYRLVVSEKNWGGGPSFEEELSLRTSLTKEVTLESPVVRGLVLTSTGRPAVGARVEAAAQPRNSFPGPLTTTDAEGRFTLREIRPEERWVDARHDGESARIARDPSSRGGVEGVLIRLVPEGHVSGVVTWEDGAVASGVPIEVTARGPVPTGAALYSGRDGRFTIDGIPAAVDIALLAVAPGDRMLPRAPGERTSFNLAAGQHRTGVNLVLSRRAETIQGVVHLPGGEAAAGTTVMADLEGDDSKPSLPGAYRTMTAADGSFTLEGLPVGSYTLWAADDQQLGPEARRILAGTRDVLLHLEPPASLAGTVVDERGRALRSYRLAVARALEEEEPGRAPTPRRSPQLNRIPVANTQGAFETGRLRPGRYEITASTADNLAGTLRNLTISAGERRTDLRIVVSAIHN